MPGLLGFLYSHFTSADFQAPPVDLTGKVGIVTGANIGLGYEGAKHLARNGLSRLILAVRTISKGEKAASQLKQELPEWKGTVEVWELDMCSFASVKAFADRLDSLERLDILIESAGVGKFDWKTTSEGWEEGLQVNVLSTGLLALRALPKLAATADLPGNTFKPHLVIVASEVHEWAKLKQQDEPSILAALNDKSKADNNDLYNLSKLLDVFMAREIAALPAARKVNVNSLNPGLCVSELRRDLPYILATIFNWIAWSTEKGARNYLYAATQDTTPGAYISFCREYEPSEFVRSEKGQKVQERIFSELKDFWSTSDPKVNSVLA